MATPEKGIAGPAMFGAMFAALSAFFCWVFYERYYKYKDCIDALQNSSCMADDGARLTSGGMFWGLFALLFGFLAAVCLGVLLTRLIRSRRRPRKV